MLLTDAPLAGVDDINIPRCVADADEAIVLLREHHQSWRDRHVAQATPAR